MNNLQETRHKHPALWVQSTSSYSPPHDAPRGAHRLLTHNLKTYHFTRELLTVGHSICVIF